MDCRPQPRKCHQSDSKLRLPADFPPGTALNGRYEVVELLGQGSNGVTYRCRNIAEGRDVAVKCLSLRRQVTVVSPAGSDAALAEASSHHATPKS